MPEFRPIRCGGGGRHRLRQAVRHRPGVLVTGLLAAATAVGVGAVRPGPLTPAPALSANTQTVAGPADSARCPSGR